MSESKNAQLDILGESHIPSDLLTPTLGSNYGMPGYEDLEYGMGVLMGVVNPDLLPPPALPTGLSKSGGGMDITDMVRENPITDLAWLEPDPAQDPARLPKSPEVLPELEALWGNATNGISVFPNSTPPKIQGELPSKTATAEQLTKVATHAMRRVVKGHDVGTVITDAMESVGANMARLAPTMRALKGEAGLLGNVYIRAAAYPGWGGGKWSKEVRKLAKDAQYIIVSERDLEQAVWIQNGRCAYTGKAAVSQIPWDDALAHYAPRLAGAGYPVGEGNPREALQEAFLKASSQTLIQSGVYATEQTGLAALASARLEGRAIESKKALEDVARAASLRDIASKARFIKAVLAEGRVSREEVRDLSLRLKSVAKVASVLRSRIAKSDLAVYDKRFFHSAVDGNPDGVSRDQVRTQVRATAKQAAAHQESSNDLASSREQATLRVSRSEARVRQLVGRVAAEIDRGARGAYLRKFIVTTIPRGDVRFASTLLDPILRETGALSEAPAEVATYEGPQFTRASSERKAKLVLSSQVSKAANWVRRTMSEGFAGEELDSIIEQRLGSKLLEASSEEIATLRGEHEGGSGFIYVDAAAYASKVGAEGCKKASLKHRANQIPAVASMGRCATCTMARTLEDGTRKCGVYNKALLEDASGPELVRIKQANIAVARMTDSEHTASFFSPTYDPSEYGLRNANLDGDVLDLPENEKVRVVMTKAWNFDV